LALRLAALQTIVNELLLDQVAAAALPEPAFRARECLHPSEEVKATAQPLRVLTKEPWDRDGLALMDACWRQATQSALFGDESSSRNGTVSAVPSRPRGQPPSAGDHSGARTRFR
jgi:hypothetical protein